MRVNDCGDGGVHNWIASRIVVGVFSVHFALLLQKTSRTFQALSYAAHASGIYFFGLALCSPVRLCQNTLSSIPLVCYLLQKNIHCTTHKHTSLRSHGSSQ